DAAGRAGDAGIVDEAIETAERIRRSIDEAGNGLAVGHVAQRRLHLGVAGRELSQRVAIDVANVHLRPFAQERAGNFATDAGCPRSDYHAQTFDDEIHGVDVPYDYVALCWIVIARSVSDKAIHCLC